MPKVCIVCGATVTKEEEKKPAEEEEDCPNCGGKGTMQDVEKIKEGEDEEE